MISASTLFCYSALSSRILITNHLITFLTLHSRYPVLQSINTYYSLIRAVYVFRVCALFCPRIASPSLYRYYPNVLSISRYCLAPPHFPESPHRTFIPQSIYSPHCAVCHCEIFTFCTTFWMTFCLYLVLCVFYNVGLVCSRRLLFSLPSWYCVISDYLGYDPFLFIDPDFCLSY